MQIWLEPGGIQGGRHHQDLKIWTLCLLEVQRPRQGDVAIEVAFVELIENERRNTFESRVLNHLPQEHALSNKANARLRAADILKADLVSHFLTEIHFAFPGNATSE